MTSETQAPELLPCPFCGGEASIVPDSEHSTAFILTHHSKGCAIDDLWAWYPDIDQAIAAWNTRADLVAAKDARIAELERVMKELRDDMLERAELRIDTIRGEEYRVVNAGNTAWRNFCAALSREGE